MQLVKATVGPFRSIGTPQPVVIDPTVTVLVGMNEAGKTVFMQGLLKAADVLESATFDHIEDYPRQGLNAYTKLHKEKPAVAVQMEYRLTDAEVSQMNSAVGTSVQQGFAFTVSHTYDNKKTIFISISEKGTIGKLSETPGLSSDAKTAIVQAPSIRQIPEKLKAISLTDADEAFLKSLNERIAKSAWPNVIQNEAWRWLDQRVPKFLYFSDYDLLPGKMNLNDLASREKQGGSQLHPKHRAVLALLRMADVSVSEFTSDTGYESQKSRIEGVNIRLTDQIMEFWKQNEDIDIEVDIKSDPADEAPYNNGPNLYLRIRNRRHRGVSTSFDQRSRGFIWFFSFLVWFDSVREQIDEDAGDRNLILLLDEPGLALHALAQADFLRYIDHLSEEHQVIYTTHSPFMIHSDRLHQVRVVEDRAKEGTVISDNVSASDSRTVFPLQAALGWTIAQNLFISENNLLVEGPSELIYLKSMSSALEQNGRPGLKVGITIVPVGGLPNLATFVALLGASGLKLAVLHDYSGAPEQRLTELAKQKLLSIKCLLNASQFRDLTALGKDGPPSDIEDLFDPSFYVERFNATFSKQLGQTLIKEGDLPKGNRIVERLERYLVEHDIQLRPSGGFNHYAVASHFASQPPKKIPTETLSRFEALFDAVNRLF